MTGWMTGDRGGQVVSSGEKMPAPALYLRFCPSCQGAISSDRLWRGLPCERCLPSEKVPVGEGEDVWQVLVRVLPSENHMVPYLEAVRRTQEFAQFFQRVTGFTLAPLQGMWTRRFFLKESFAIVSPPGLGKTTWGLTLSLFLTGKVLVLVPTRLLGQQIYEKLQQFQANVEGQLRRRILFYRSVRGVREAFQKGEYDILIGTLRFFYAHLSDLERVPFEMVFIDDVDSFLKQPRSVERLMRFLGISEELIRRASQANLSSEELEQVQEDVRRLWRGVQLILSSATLKPRPRQVRLFRRLLGFDIQQGRVTLRAITDTHQRVAQFEEMIERAGTLIRRLGGGGLIYVSSLYGTEGVRRVARALAQRGINTVSYLDYSPDELVARLQSGGFDVAIGLSHPLNPLVRGIDFPYILRYAIFLDPPVFLFPMEPEPVPARLYTLLLHVVEALPVEERAPLYQWLGMLRRYRYWRSEHIVRRPALQKKMEEIAERLRVLLHRRDILSYLEGRSDVGLRQIDGKWHLVVADATTYIQATGRTSRLTPHGLTEGLSVVLYQDEKAMNSLIRRLALFYPGEEIAFKPLEQVDLDTIRGRLEASRRTREGVRPSFSSALVIVESPTKAQTLASFMGKPQRRVVHGVVAYEVAGRDRLWIFAATLGHVVDLVTREGIHGVRSVASHPDRWQPCYDTIKTCQVDGQTRQFTDIDQAQFHCPDGWKDKLEVIQGLRHLAFQVDEVYIATDPDTEGEKIGYDSWEALRPFQPRLARTEFHEVTPRAFWEAVASARAIDMRWVRAQLARRIADRWVGFTLSQDLWRRFGVKKLSAGRVQTPVLGWIIARTDESRQRVYVVVFRVGSIALEVVHATREEALRVYRLLKEGRVRVVWSSPEEEERSPAPPFTTDTVLQEASHRFGFSATYTMQLLQELFEKGLITYHRTDSIHVSMVGRYQVAQPYILKVAGEEYFQSRAWAREGTHEAIRPTRPLDQDDLRVQIAAGVYRFMRPEDSLRLYQLIFRRFMASQSANARVVVRVLRVELPSGEELTNTRVVTGIVFDGFYRFGDAPRVVSTTSVRVTGVGWRVRPKAYPYTQGELIRRMKERGLGRPSTYAQIIQTLLKRGYVVERKGRLVATSLGRKVYAYLCGHRHARLVSEEFTRDLEALMDAIARGEERFGEVVGELAGLLGLGGESGSRTDICQNSSGGGGATR